MDCDEASSQPVICDLQRLIYVCRACLRLIVIYTIEVYPAHISPNGSKPIQETSKLAECIYDSRTLFQQILTDGLSVLQGSKTYQLYQTGVNLTKIVKLKNSWIQLHCNLPKTQYHFFVNEASSFFDHDHFHEKSLKLNIQSSNTFFHIQKGVQDSRRFKKIHF